MRIVKKYSSFEELKSTENLKTDKEIIKNRHSEFEKAIKTLMSEKKTNPGEKHID